MHDSMFAMYFEELDGSKTIFSEQGFAVYKLEEDHIYLKDIFIKPEFRHSGAGHKLLESVSVVGKKAGKTKLVGSVVPSYSGGPKRVMGMLKSGFEVLQAQNDIIFFVREIL